MRSRQRLMGAASVMLAALAFQGASQLRPNLAPPRSSMLRPERWTAQNVSGERPFGTIDVTQAGSSVQSVRLWTLGRSVLERYEITAVARSLRCRRTQVATVRAINNSAATMRWPDLHVPSRVHDAIAVLFAVRAVSTLGTPTARWRFTPALSLREIHNMRRLS